MSNPQGIALVLVLVLLMLGGVAYHARALYASVLSTFYAQAYASALAALALLTVLLLPLTRFPTLPSLVGQGLLLGMLINGLAFWGVAGPWDLLPLSPLPPPARNLTTTSLPNSSAIYLNWRSCPQPPPATLYALTLNGALVYTGREQGLQLLGLPRGANLTGALALSFADGSSSSFLMGPSHTVS